MDAPGQLGLQRAEMPVASGSLLPHSSVLDKPWAKPRALGTQTTPRPASYPVAVLQEAGEVAVRGLEANEVRVTLLLHQEEPFRIISGHCGDKSLSLTLGPDFWGPFLALQMTQNFLFRGVLSPHPVDCRCRREIRAIFQGRDPWRLFLVVAPRKGNDPHPPRVHTKPVPSP